MNVTGRTHNIKMAAAPYLPLDAVLQPVADLVLGLKEEVLEGRWGAPADAQLILQVTHAAHVEVPRGVGGDCNQRAMRSQGQELHPFSPMVCFGHLPLIAFI